MSTSTTTTSPHTVIKPREGWQLIDFRELFAYRDLFYFLVWRDVKVRYAQSVLGVGWAVIQPVFGMIIFTIIFGRLAHLDSDGVPYAIFSFTALVPWAYFSNAMTDSSTSLVINADMIQKIYFPRLIIPLTSILAKLVDFTIAFALLLLMMPFFKIIPTANIIFVPYLILLMTLTAAGIGMWLTALAIQFRDVRYGLNFGVQLLMYASPVVYSIGLIPENLRIYYALNPLVGVIEGFRASLLGTSSMPWSYIGVGSIVAVLLFITGALYFRRMEKIFADVA
ncbi:MAG TPA: ABC transporter permease [Opitutales bacterium]|nr:ABC transporter permease [Opitutales bacterium]